MVVFEFDKIFRFKSCGRGMAWGAGQIMKAGFGVLLVVFGALVLTGIDKRVETTLVNTSPQWLTDLTTRF
jgi:hypothetical protein